MSNMLIVYRNYVDEGSLSGGDWSPGLPLANLAHRHPSRVARTAGTDATDTWFQLDLGAPRPIAFLGLLNHNLSQAGKWRIRVGQAADLAAPDYDSGWQPIWPRVQPFGAGLWGEFEWGGQLDSGLAETYGIGSYHLIGSPLRCRFARIDLADPPNGAGYLQAGRAIVAPVWRPTVNLQFGWSIEQVDDSRVVRSRGGQAYVDSRPKFRRLRFSLEHLAIDEMLAHAYELERIKGKGGDVLVMIDPEDTAHLHRRTVYGLIAETTPIINPFADRYSKEFVIEELH